MLNETGLTTRIFQLAGLLVPSQFFVGDRANSEAPRQSLNTVHACMSGLGMVHMQTFTHMCSTYVQTWRHIRETMKDYSKAQNAGAAHSVRSKKTCGAILTLDIADCCRLPIYRICYCSLHTKILHPEEFYNFLLAGVSHHGPVSKSRR